VAERTIDDELAGMTQLGRGEHAMTEAVAAVIERFKAAGFTDVRALVLVTADSRDSSGLRAWAFASRMPQRAGLLVDLVRTIASEVNVGRHERSRAAADGGGRG
jgi:hypothetical protein